jgi:hypothetical protein
MRVNQRARKMSRNNQMSGAPNSVMPRTNMLSGNISVEIKSIHHVKIAQIELTIASMNSMRCCYSHHVPTRHPKSRRKLSHVPPCKAKTGVCGAPQMQKNRSPGPVKSLFGPWGCQKSFGKVCGDNSTWDGRCWSHVDTALLL